MFTPGQAVKLSLILWLSILPSVAAQLRAQHQHPSFNLNDSYNNNSTSNNDKTKRYLKKPKRIVIVSDIGIKLSGVHTCLTNTVRVLEDMGYDVMYLNPVSLNLWTFPLYGIDRHFLAPIVLPWEAEEISQMVTEFKPDHIHIHTPRGPLTAILLDLCNKNAWKFSTAFTTDMAGYLNKKIFMPKSMTWMWLRSSYSESSSVMATTHSNRQMLIEHGFDPKTLRIWGRGVDLEIYHPRAPDPLKFPKTDGLGNFNPIVMYVGRISAEKGIDDFLKLPLPGYTKYVVGDGPELPSIQRQYHNVTYLGVLSGNDLAAAYSNADVVVFPSKTDTFGNTIIESLACGTPVAGFPVVGPKDIINSPGVGSVNENLEIAIKEAYSDGDPEECVTYVSKHFTWEIATQQFLDNLVPIKCDNPAGCRMDTDTSHALFYRVAFVLVFVLVLLGLKRYNYWPVIQGYMKPLLSFQVLCCQLRVTKQKVKCNIGEDNHYFQGRTKKTTQRDSAAVYRRRGYQKAVTV